MDKTFTKNEVAAHITKESCWIIIHGKVLDVTKYLNQHPGTETPLLENAGRDATQNFERVGHSNNAKELIKKYQIGII